MNRVAIILMRVIPGAVVRLMEGIWAVPLFFVILGLATAFGIDAVPERFIGFQFEKLLEEFEPETARLVLTTAATGVMTAASIVFSLTFVTLTLTAQQLSPRILDYVLRNRVMQVMIGMAIATFLFCIVTLMLTGTDPPWRVGLAASVASLMAAATLALVVVFAFRMSKIIRADETVARLGEAFVTAMRRAVDGPGSCVDASGASAEAALPDFDGGAEVKADEAGYTGSIDLESLVSCAADNDICIELLVWSNQFVLPGEPVARIAGLHPEQEAPSAAILGDLNLSDRRVPGFEADYEGAALSEAAIRAMSPGINDPATARAALNRLFEGIAILATGDEPPRILGKKADVALLYRPVRGVREFLTTVVAPVGEACARDTQVTKHLLNLTRILEGIALRPGDRRAIAEFRAGIEAGEFDGMIEAPGS